MSNKEKALAEFEALRSQHIDAVRLFTAEAVQRLSWSREKVQEEQTKRLRKIIAHAQQSSPFYADRLGHIEASTFEVSDLVNIPPLTKQEVMGNWDRLVTDSHLRLEEVAAHLERLHLGSEPNPYYLGKYYAAATGGLRGRGVCFFGTGRPSSFSQSCLSNGKPSGT